MAFGWRFVAYDYAKAPARRINAASKHASAVWGGFK